MASQLRLIKNSKPFFSFFSSLWPGVIITCLPAMRNCSSMADIICPKNGPSNSDTKMPTLLVRLDAKERAIELG